MRQTYRAIEIAEAGLQLVHRDVPVPEAGEVLLAVEACGICGADASDIDRADPALRRVPGHEVVGRILAIGAGLPSLWRVGQRVGVGRLGGPCGQCPFCRQGRFNLCADQPVTGSSRDGGYAEMMLARASGLVAIPDDLSSEEAAPILCAGLATFNALKSCGAQAGDTLAVFGIGGLGHMALQYARRMGFRTVAIGRGEDTGADVLALGAHRYIDTDTQDAAAELARMAGAQAILATPVHAAPTAALLPGLAPGGRLVLLGVGRDPLSVSMGAIVGGERGVIGSLTGSPHDAERALHFSQLVGARPWIETVPLERAAEAVARMRSGAAKFRMVLVMEAKDADPQ
jgi:alcohol dehydrogenase